MKQEPRSAWNTIIAQYKNKGAFVLNLKDPEHKEFLYQQLKMADVREEWFPAFFQHLDQAATVEKQPSLLSFGSKDDIYPAHTISSINWTESNHLEATAITSIPTVATHISQTLGFFNANREPIGLVAHSQTFNQGNDSVIQATAKLPEGGEWEEMIVIYTFTQTLGEELLPAAEIVSTVRYPDVINNLMPTNVLGKNQIKICLTRQDTDCDYFNTYPGYNFVMVPIQGSMIYFESIDLQDGKPVNANAEIYLLRVLEGGSIISPADGFKFFDAAGVTVNDKTLSWNLDWLKFNQVDFQSGDEVYYVFKVALQVQGEPVVGFITNAPNSVAPEQTIRNTATLPPMYILYGCLAEGTLIQLEDGTVKAIEDIEPGEWIRSDNGQCLRVEYKTIGVDRSCLEIHYRSDAELEGRLTTSSAHPLKTKTGDKQAAEIQLGDLLAQPHGFAEVVAMEAIRDEITVYNLHLGGNPDTMLNPHQGSYMIANGILVGDSRMQKVLAYQRELTRKQQAIPEKWERDYQNYLKFKSR